MTEDQKIRACAAGQTEQQWAQNWLNRGGKNRVHTWSPQKLRSIHLIGVADQRGVLPLLDKTCLRLS